MAITAARVTVTTSATRLDQDQTDDVRALALVVRNQGSISVDLGGATVTAGAGFRLAPGESASLRVNAYDAGLYGITASSTCVLDVLQAGI